MPAVPMPDAETEATVSNARAEAAGALKGQFPDSMLAPSPELQGHVRSLDISNSATVDPQAEAAAAPPPAEPGPDAIPVHDFTPAPTADAKPVKDEPDGFFADEFKGTGRVVLNHVMAGFASIGGALGRSGTGMAAAEDPAHAEDTLQAGHQYIDKVTDDAYNEWIKGADDASAGGAAQVLGGVSEALPSMLTGPLGMPIVAADQRSHELINQGIDPKTAAKEALVTAVATAAGMKISHAFPGLTKWVRASIQHVAGGAVANTAIQAAQNNLDKFILKSDGFKEAAAKIDPSDPSTIGQSGIMGMIYGAINAFAHRNVKPKAAAPAEAPDLEVKPQAALPPPPIVKTAGEIAGAPPEEMASKEQLPTDPMTKQMGDKPSAEPPSDLKAQVAAIGDTRKHVYLSAENVKNLGPDGVKALAGKLVVTKNFDKAGGVLISENHSERSKATALRTKNGADMQATLGKLTGAGEGKTPEQNTVVQGQTPEGAVVKESTVAPHEVPAAVADVQAAGHTPVVTTPEAAQVRRAEGVAHEASIAPEPGLSAKPVVEEKTAAPEASSEAITPTPATPVPLKKGDRHIIKIAGEDVPVVVAGDPVDNKVPVHTVDEEGELSKDVRNVPADMFKPKERGEPVDMTKSKEDRALERERVAAQRAKEEGLTPEPEPEPIPARAAEHEGVVAKRMAAEPSISAEVPKGSSDAQEVLQRLRAAEAIPSGKKFPASISDRAATIAETARAVKALAAKPGIDPKVAEDALAAARRVSKLDLKTPEQMEKNQGLSHKMMDAHSRELQRVLGNLADGKAVFSEAPVQIKAEKLKAKIEKERAKATSAELAAHTAEVKKPFAQRLKEQQAAKVKSAIPDVQDETKPKTLNRGEQERVANALDRYSKVGDLDVQEAHDNLERVIREAYGEHPASKAFADQILTLAREQRADAEHTRSGGPRRMSDTVDEEELKGHNYDPAEHDYNPEDEYDDPKESRAEDKEIAATSPIGKLHKALDGTGFWKKLSDLRDSGGFTGTHKMLDHLIKVSKQTGNGHMLTLLEKLRANAPDLPIRPVEETIHPSDGKPMGGVGSHHALTQTIQVKVNRLSGYVDSAPFSGTHAIIHEIVHGATSYELYHHPTGEFATEVKGLLSEARSRASLMNEDHYGLKNEHEFLAEALTNPVFQKFLADSEMVAKTRTYTGKTAQPTNVLARLGRAIAKMLGFNGDPKLLHDVMSLGERTIEQQGKWFDRDIASSERLKNMDPKVRDRLINQSKAVEDDHMPGLDSALDKLDHLEEPPPDLQHEDEFRSIAGNHATDLAKLFRRAVRSGAVETIRRTVRSLTPYDGLVRAALRRGVFGHDDATNPLRNYNELIQQRDGIINRMAHSAEQVVNLGAKLSTKDDRALGQFQSDVGDMGIHIEKPLVDQPKRFLDDKKAVQKYADMQARWKNLTDQQKDVYRAERDWNEKAIRANRRAGVDVAIDSFTDSEISKAQRQLLYSVKTPHAFEELIGKGKEIDVGDRNDKLTGALQDLASTSEIEGDYFHKGRYGEHVVQIRPEGLKEFPNQAAAEVYADKVRALSPKSKAKVEMIGGKWTVDYKAEYVSMHESPAEADKDVERLRNQGHDVGSVTQKVLSEKNAPISDGMQNIIAEASRKLGTDDAGEDLKESLRQAFVSLMAARSSYAGSKLARRNVGGVKADEMRRSFATHAQSLSWNTGHMATVFKVGEALGALRNAAKDDSRPQNVASQRGRVYDEVQRRLRQETQQFGSKVPLNATIAKLGFLNYMTSVSHALVYITQNFTTAIPRAGAKFGYGRSAKVFGDAMAMVTGPAFRETYRAALGQNGHNVESIQNAMIAAVANHPRLGKWAKGGKDSPLQQLIDRGVIHTSLSNQLATTAKGGSKFANTVMEWARILPSMADMFNRISSGVAALELHNGDVYKAGDFVKETHIDYSQANKPRMFRQFNSVPFGNSVTMFKSYVTGMSHLLYSHVYDAVAGTHNDSGLGGRGEALKVVAGMMVGTALFAGLQRGFGLEPIRMMFTAYQHLVGDNNEYYSFDNTTRRAVADLVGKGKMAEVIDGGLPRAFGFDMSSRLGLSDLWLHDPPDLLSLDSSAYQKLIYAQLGPAVTGIGDMAGALHTAMTTGRVDDIAKAVPIKLVHNVFDAYSSAVKGKQTHSGAQITDPSPGAAVSHLVGFRTAEEARVAEKSATDTEYKDFAGSNKYGLLTAYVRLDPKDRKEFFDKNIVKWNAANPGHRITIQDIVKQLRSNARTERVTKGLPSRDPVQNKLNDY